MAVAIVMPTAGARAIALTALLFAPIGVVAPKGLVLLLFAVGLWLLFRALGQGRLVPVFTGATAMLFGLFTTWALVSAAWSLDAGASVITTAKLAAVLLAALLVLDAVRQLPDRDAAAVGGALVIGYAVAALLLAAESLSGGLAHQALYRLQERSHEFDMSILNRAGAMLLLAAWPVALELRRRAGPGLAILAIVVAMAIALGGVGNSNQVAVLAAASAAIAAWWLGRRLCTSLAVLLVILIVAAPLLPRSPHCARPRTSSLFLNAPCDVSSRKPPRVHRHVPGHRTRIASARPVEGAPIPARLRESGRPPARAGHHLA